MFYKYIAQAVPQKFLQIIWINKLPKHKYYLRQNPAKKQIYTSMLNVWPTPFEEQGNEQRNYLQALAILGPFKVNNVMIQRRWV